MTSPIDAVDVIIVQAPTTTPVLTVKVPGPQGPPGVFEMGPVTTGAAGTQAFADVVEENGIKTVSFTIPRGNTGAAALMSVGNVFTGNPGSSTQASITGAAPNYLLNLTIPRGDKGDKGDQGIQGIQGPQGVVGPKGSDGAGIQIAGQVNAYANLPTGLTSADAGKAYFVVADGKLYIWSGTAFPANGSGTTFQGPVGPANTLTMGGITTGAAGTSANASITGAAPNQTLSLTIPRGADGATGATGAPGPANTLVIGTVTTATSGSSADATITGAAPNQTLNLSLPRGADGAQGAQGIQGPAGANGTGLLVLGATDPVPAGTPANTVIYRPAIKTSNYFWGTGTTYPTGGLTVGDTFVHTNLSSLMRWNGGGWRQAEPAELVNAAARDAISTTYSSLLYKGFTVFTADTNRFWRWDGTAWQYAYGGGGPEEFAVSFNSNATSYDPAWYTPSYSKGADGFVTIVGMAKLLVAVSNTNGIVIGSIPAGYRPSKSVMGNGAANNASVSYSGRTDVDSVGNLSFVNNSGVNFAVNSWFNIQMRYKAV